MTANSKKIVIAEFGSPLELIHVAEKLRDSEYKNFDCHSPFPIHGMDSAMGLGRSKLGWVVAAFATVGFTIAIILQWYASTIAYPLVISGKPFFSYQAFFPVTFALAVLFSAIATLFGMMVFNKLPRLNHPVFESEIFKKATDDGFFVTIEPDGRDFDFDSASKYLKQLGSENIEVI